jgi:carboxymethylenebutenolidase
MRRKSCFMNMERKMSDITFEAKDGSGSFNAYIAVPTKTPAPAIILIQEIFGVNEEMRKKCDELAKQGFLAICPDLFWRMEPNVQLTDQSEEEWQKAFGFYNNFNIDLGIEDLEIVERNIKEHQDCSGKTGCVGFCLGGKLAYLMASRTSVQASVSFYGVGIEEMLDEAGNIKFPTLLHIAEEDEFVTKEAQQAIASSFADNPLISVYSYPGVNHAFARGGGVNYNEEAANLANQRTIAFLEENLEMVLAA